MALRPVVRQLVESGEALAPEVRVAALAEGSDIVEDLCGLLLDPEQYGTEASTAWGPLHALRILGELRAPEAVPALVAFLADADPFGPEHLATIQALTAVGPAALEPLLAAPPGSPDFEHARAEVLADLGHRDPRILALLLAELEHDPALAASNLLEYGDPDAVPALSRALDALEVGGDVAPTDLVEVADAITGLGGTLTAAQATQRDAAARLTRESGPLLRERMSRP